MAVSFETSRFRNVLKCLLRSTIDGCNLWDFSFVKCDETFMVLHYEWT